MCDCEAKQSDFRNSAVLWIGMTVMLTMLASNAIAVPVTTTGDARVLTEPSGLRDVDNGGNTITGRLIGINVGGIDNFMAYEFADLSAVTGLTVSGATVEVVVSTGFQNANHGSTADLININELAITNIGWDPGNGIIGGSSNNTDDGSISYQNRVQFFGTGETWLDASGAAVGNIEGALSMLGSIAGYNQGAAPATLTFSIDAGTAQGWVDNGLAGLVFSATDDGDSRSRFNFGGQAVTIDFEDGNSGVSADFNGDEILDCSDVDALTSEIVAGTHSDAFDLTGDGFVQSDDLAKWLTDAGATDLPSGNSYLVGDTTLDGMVGSDDLGLLLNNFGSTGGVVAYCGGDLDAGSSVDSADLGLLLNSFGQSASAVQVPEPSGNALGIVFLLLFGFPAKRK